MSNYIQGPLGPIGGVAAAAIEAIETAWPGGECQACGKDLYAASLERGDWECDVVRIDSDPPVLLCPECWESRYKEEFCGKPEWAMTNDWQPIEALTKYQWLNGDQIFVHYNGRPPRVRQGHMEAMCYDAPTESWCDWEGNYTNLAQEGISHFMIPTSPLAQPLPDPLEPSRSVSDVAMDLAKKLIKP